MVLPPEVGVLKDFWNTIFSRVKIHECLFYIVSFIVLFCFIALSSFVQMCEPFRMLKEIQSHRERWDVRQSVEVSNFKTSWADHFNMPKEYFNVNNQEKPPTIDVLVKLLSRTQAPSSTSPEVAGGHIDALTSPRHGVAW